MAILTVARTPGYGALVTWAAIAHVRRWSEEQRATWRANGKLDMVNARTNKLVWRGWAQDNLQGMIDSQDRMQAHTKEAVTKMLAAFPRVN